MKKIILIITLIFLSISYSMEIKSDSVDTIKTLQTKVKKAKSTPQQPKTNWSKIKDLFM